MYVCTYVRMYVRAYMHTCIHAHMHTCIHTCLHTYIRTYLRTHVPTYLRTYGPTDVRTYVRRSVRLSIHPSIHTAPINFMGVYPVLSWWNPHYILQLSYIPMFFFMISPWRGVEGAGRVQRDERDAAGLLRGWLVGGQLSGDIKKWSLRYTDIPFICHIIRYYTLSYYLCFMISIVVSFIPPGF